MLAEVNSQAQRFCISLCILLVGIGLATVGDIDLGIYGAALAILTVLSTAGVTSATHIIQKKYSVTSNQFLANCLATQAGIMLLSGPMLDKLLLGSNVFLDFAWNVPALISVGSTCLVAVGVNIFTCFLLGKTSAVSYQVVGHLKTVVILIGGYLIFDAHTSSKVAGGGFVALVGCITYGALKEQELHGTASK